VTSRLTTEIYPPAQGTDDTLVGITSCTGAGDLQKLKPKGFYGISGSLSPDEIAERCVPSETATEPIDSEANDSYERFMPTVQGE
jgi:hypothetical protein